MFLSPEQIRDLTGRQRPSAQARVLRDMGIKHGCRPDGSIVVLVAAVDAVLGVGAAGKLARKTGPNLALVV